MTKAKPFWQSKTLWMNVIAGVALIVQSQTGYLVTPDTQAFLLVCLNGVLRVVSKDGISLT